MIRQEGPKHPEKKLTAAMNPANKQELRPPAPGRTRNRLTQVGLGTKLLVLTLLLSLVPLGVKSFADIRQLNSQLESSAMQTMQTALDGKATLLGEWLTAHQGTVQTLAVDARVVAMEGPAVSAWLRPLVAAGYLPFENFNLAGPDGKLIGSTLTEEQMASITVSDRDYFKAAMSGKAFIADPTISRATGNLVVNMAAPVKQGNQMVGVFFGSLNANVLRNMLAQGLDQQHTRAYLVSRAGGFLVRPPAWNNTNDTNLNLKTPVLAGIQTGQAGQITRYADPVGTQVHGVFQLVSPVNWGVVIEQDSVVVDRQVTAQIRTAIMLLLLTAGVVLLGSWLLSRSISKPIRRLKEQLEVLASGEADLTQQITVISGDEIGQVALAFNAFTNTLRSLIQQLKGSVQSVLTVSEELSAASDQSAQVAQGAAQAVGQVAGGASEQARAADEVSRTMEQLQQTIQQIATGANQSTAEVQQAAELLNRAVDALKAMAADAGGVADGTNRAAQVARDGAGVVNRAVEGMEHIRQVVGESATQIKGLAQLSGQIGEITAVISGIAEQTNLLALNAAIEAARAGEHGRGFAVVADEVRKLAERSDRSAKEIARLIQTIQEQTAKAVQTMAAGTTEVERGTDLAAQAGRSLQDIRETVEKAAADVQGIARAAMQVQGDANSVVQAFDALAALTEENTAATEEMAAGATQATQTTVQIADVSQGNAAAAEEVSASVEELTASSEEVAASARNLANIAHDLQQQVARFKV